MQPTYEKNKAARVRFSLYSPRPEIIIYIVQNPAVLFFLPPGLKIPFIKVISINKKIANLKNKFMLFFERLSKEKF